MHAKRFMALSAMLVTLAAPVTAQSPDPVSPAPGSMGAEPFTMTYVPGVANEEFYISMACGAEEAAARLGVTLDVQAGDTWDPAVQTPIVNAIVERGSDAIIIAPNDRTAMVPPLKAAADAGVKLVIVDTGLDDYSFTASHIASSNRDGGRQAGENLAQLIGGTGKIVIIGGTPGVTTSEERSLGFNEAIAQYPDIELLDQQYTVNSGAEEAAQQMSAVVAAHPDIAGVFAIALVAAQGVATALEQNDLDGKVKVVSFDAGPAQVEALRAGTIDGLIAQKPSTMGQMGVEQALAALTGAPTEPELSPGFVQITKANMDDPEISQWFYKDACG